MSSRFLSFADFYQNKVFRKILTGIPSECRVKQFGSRSSPVICRAKSRSKLFANVICYQKTNLVGKTLAWIWSYLVVLEDQLLGLSLYLRKYVMYASSECSSEPGGRAGLFDPSLVA